MNKIYLCITATLLSWLCGNAQCVTNGSFENNSQYSSAYFTFRRGVNNTAITDCHINTQNLPLLTHSTLTNQFDANEPEGGTWTVSSPTAIVYDPMLASAITVTNGQVGAPAPIYVPVVSSGTRAVKLNKSSGNGDVTSMSMKLVTGVTSISFDYSLIMDYHPGTPDLQPFFNARIFDDKHELISANEICIKADPTDPIFSTANIPVGTLTYKQVLYTGWNCARIEIPAAYINKNLTLEFVVTDCTQNQHFGTVYLDNVQCSTACSTPDTGFLALNEFTTTCTAAPFQICGKYTPPTGSTLDANGLVLTIFDANNNPVISPITTTSSLTASTFCFTVNPALFNTTAVGNYEIRVDASFTHTQSGFHYNLFDSSSGAGPDIVSVIDHADTYTSGNYIYWPDIADSYELEFISDGVCCPTSPSSTDGKFYSITTTDNYFDSYAPCTPLISKCYRWRIKTSCGGWSDWCCLTSSELTPWLDAGMVNYYEPQCYDDNTILSCDPSLYATANVTGLAYEQREIFINAVNTISAGGEAAYQAGQYIQLQPGFLSNYNSVFLAKIADCTGAAGQAATSASTIRQDMHTHNDSEDKLELFPLADINKYNVYPNPADEKITIESPYLSETYTILDITGKIVMTITNETKDTKMEVNISQLNSGIYFLRVKGNLIQKIIKN